MRTALVIGASRGIGREFVEELVAARWKVFATARDEAGMAALRDAGAEPIKLDVTRTESLSGLAWQLDGIKLDLAVYVSGIFGPHVGAHHPPATHDFDAVMHTNVLGAMQLIPTVAPLVEEARGKFIFITSGMASVNSVTSSDGWVYRVSKAALNMAVKAASTCYPNAALVVMSPGWVRTDMGGPDATSTAQKSVGEMIKVIEELTLQDTGSFRAHTGEHIAW
jgi:NAD(P)-dependent dehydrogenase (short-subunit alcohol dehydrogenase family)